MDPNSKITKMLSPEETELLGTLQSTLNQLLSLQNQPGETPGSNDLEETLKKLAGLNMEDKEDQEKEEPQKAEKEDNGPTANEKAEDRLKAETEINDKNLSEVGKALLLALINKNKQPVKNNQNQALQIDTIVNAVVKQLAPLVNEVAQIKQFNENVLDALGYTEKIEKSFDQNQNVNKGQLPVQSIDATGVVNELVEVIKSMQKENQKQKTNTNNDWNGMQETRKDLGEAMPLIFKNAQKR
jgi:hypothetical protein